MAASSKLTCSASEGEAWTVEKGLEVPPVTRLVEPSGLSATPPKGGPPATGSMGGVAPYDAVDFFLPGGGSGPSISRILWNSSTIWEEDRGASSS